MWRTHLAMAAFGELRTAEAGRQDPQEITAARKAAAMC